MGGGEASLEGMTPVPPKVAQLLMALGRLPPDEARALLRHAAVALDAVERHALAPLLPTGLVPEVLPATPEGQTMPWPTPVEPSPSTGKTMARAFPRRPRR